VRLQDDVAQIGQGRIADRSKDHPGLADVGVIALRKLWRRELLAFAQGKETKTWQRKTGMGPSAWGQRGVLAGERKAQIVDVRPHVEVDWQLRALAGQP
jgi:5,5'-dehydrodivanillate O-demethylase oxygenase subunit